MKLIATLWLLLCPAFLYAQNANVTFSADTTIHIKLYGEIDNGINLNYPTDTIRLTPDKTVCRKISISDFSYLSIQYSSGARYTLLIFPDDEITVHYSNNRIEITGDNREGQLFLNRYFQTGLSAYIEEYTDSWEKYTRNEIDYKALTHAMQKDTVLLHERIGMIEALVREQKISQKFAGTFIENMRLFKQAHNIHSLRTLLLAKKFKSRIEKDSLDIANSIDSLFALFPNENPQFIVRASKQRNGSNYLTQYFYHHFRNSRIDEESRCFYNLFPYLHATQEVQSTLIGRSLAASISLGVGEHLKENCTHFMERYPNSGYVALLKEYVKEPAHDSEIDITVIDGISSLSELAAVEQLKGKYILVDLWATWCIPCRREFEFKQPLDELVQSFKDLVLVYISLDEGSSLQKWRDVARKYKLEGIHTVANKELQKDIRNKVFNGTSNNVLLPTTFTIKDNAIEGHSITVPRYFLMDKNGRIVHNDLPRPGKMELLKSTLEKIVADSQ